MDRAPAVAIPQMSAVWARMHFRLRGLAHMAAFHVAPCSWLLTSRSVFRNMYAPTCIWPLDRFALLGKALSCRALQ